MLRIFPNFCIPRTPETVAMAKYIVPGTVFSILFGVAFSAYLILEMETNEQLLTLNDKLKTLQIDVGTKQEIVDQLTKFNEDLQKNVYAYDKNFAQTKEGAVVEIFYGKELTHSLSFVQDFTKLMGLHSSRACNLLRSDLDPEKYLQFKGGRAGVLIRLVAPIAIHTIQYDHWIPNYKDDQLVTATPKKMHFFGLKNTTRAKPIHLGETTLLINRNSHHQQTILHLEPKDYYQHIRFDIVSNHGHPDHTIAYKLSVFGNLKPEY